MAATYRQTYAWIATGGTGDDRYIRAQPVFRSTVMPGRSATLVGFKVWVTEYPRGASFGLRVDVGGGQTDTEGDETRALVAASLPTPGFNSGFTPVTLFATDREPEQFGDTFAVFQGWPGCYGCMPVFCDDTIRLLVTQVGLEPLPAWRLAVNATLWLRDDT
jgi:hypothetical protein